MKKKYPGFTLVELLTVIAIIGLLAAILIPAVNNALVSSRHTAYMANARSIASAHQSYVLDRNRRINPQEITSLGDFAALMVRWNYLESAEVFFATDDWLAPDPIPRSLAIKSGDEWKASPEFGGADAYSVDMAIGVSSTSASTTTPLVWGRGLQTDGSWGDDGLWGRNRGFMIYAGGNVEKLESMGEGGDARLLHYTNRTPTNNVLEALPASVTVRGRGAGSLDDSTGKGD